MEIPRTARIPIEVDVDALLPSGQEAPLTQVRWALCDRSGPTADTVWVDGLFDPEVDVATAIACGPDAEDTTGVGVLILDRPRAQLWALPVQEGASVPGFIDTLELL